MSIVCGEIILCPDIVPRTCINGDLGRDYRGLNFKGEGTNGKLREKCVIGPFVVSWVII